MSLDQPSTYLFTESGLAAMGRFIDEETLFAFDLDGTLAPIVSDPGAIGIPDPVRKEIAILGEHALVAVITGRSRLDALRHLGFAPAYLIGNHGAEGLPGKESRTEEFVSTVNGWQKQLSVLMPDNEHNGVILENKGPTLSLHYRQAADGESTQARILQAVGKLVPQPRRISGKCIENLIPEGAPDKGVALSLLMQKTGRRKAFFTGDDETDENVFRLSDKNIFTVRVDRSAGSLAKYHLQGQHEVARLLREINRRLQQIKQ